MKKQMSLLLAAAMLTGSLTACSGNATTSGVSSGSSTSGAAPRTSSATSSVPSYNDLKVGEDYTDIKAELRVITQRTDLIDNVFAEYVSDFNQLYPNIKINYEGITNYGEDMTTRISSKNWGDVCMIPTTILLPDLYLYFHPLCSLDEIKDTYNFASNRAYDGSVFGIPSTGNAQGIVYNKAVAEKAGYSADETKGLKPLPKTPDEFLQFLQDIKDNTDAIPLYTNFADNWPMGAWDAYIGGGATADADWMNITMPQTKDPFADRGNGTGPYVPYYILYEAVKRGLTEESPTATDWEGCKPMMNNGQIGVLVLGSWAVIQMQQAGPNAADIGYMPFPITQPDGKMYASAGADYCFGVNKNISDNNKIASMLYIKWFTEFSKFSYDQGGIPILKTEEYPDTLSSFEGIELIEDTPAPNGLAELQPLVNRESEISLNMDNTHVQRIVEAVVTGKETLEDIINDWNSRWNQAVERYAPQQ